MSKNSFDISGYENIILLRDFNMTPDDKNLQHFIDCFSLENLINKPICFKGIPSCIDLSLTIENPKNIFAPITGISDFHKVMAFSLKTQMIKTPQKASKSE